MRSVASSVPHASDVPRTSVLLEVVESACTEALAAGACNADVVLNILARQRHPAPPTTIPTQADLCLHLDPTTNCRRYDR